MHIGKEHPRQILFIGDSHTEQYWKTLENISLQKTTFSTLIFMNKSVFPPEISSEALQNHSIHTVFLSYFWALKYGSDRVNQTVRCCGAGKNGLIGENTLPLYNEKQMDEIDQKIKKTLLSLKKYEKQCYIILDNPFGQELDPHSMLVRDWNGIKVHMMPPLTKDVALQRAEPVRSRLIRLAKETNCKIIDPFLFLCNDKICSAFAPNSELLYKDYDHLSFYTSNHYVRYLDFLTEK